MKAIKYILFVPLIMASTIKDVYAEKWYIFDRHGSCHGAPFLTNLFSRYDDESLKKSHINLTSPTQVVSDLEKLGKNATLKDYRELIDINLKNHVVQERENKFKESYPKIDEVKMLHIDDKPVLIFASHSYCKDKLTQLMDY